MDTVAKAVMATVRSGWVFAGSAVLFGSIGWVPAWVAVGMAVGMAVEGAAMAGTAAPMALAEAPAV